MASFIKDIEEIRQRAVEKIEDGPITVTYRGDKDKAISILNDALATEIVCVLRYMHHYFMATGVHGRAVADEFKEHADSEREHAGEIAERIQQLGGKPDFNPASLLKRSVSQYIEGETLSDMIREDLIAERMVIEVYQEMIRYFGNNDPTTRNMIEHILAEEEEHAADLSDLLFVVNPHTGETEGHDRGVNPLAIERSRQSRQTSGTPDEEEGEDYSSTQLNLRGQRHPNPQDDVRGRDREYDGVQQMAAPGRTKERTGRESGNRQEGNSSSKTGGTRSPKIVQKNRKNKRVA
jgi:bacterioferritin